MQLLLQLYFIKILNKIKNKNVINDKKNILILNKKIFNIITIANISKII